jgi:hypothetical protein
VESGDDVLLGVAMARVMGHVALGLCDGERPAALGLDASELPAGSAVMVCPIGCSVSSTGQGVLVGIYGPVVPSSAPKAGPLAPAPGPVPEEQRLRSQREQLMVLARRLAVVMQ